MPGIADRVLDKYLRAARENPAYSRFLFRSFVSSIGFWLQNAAQYWIVVNLTHSGAMLGVLSLCLYGPYAVFGLIGGAVADRFDRRAAVIWSQAILAGCAATIGVFSVTGWGGLAPIFAVSIVRSLVLCVGQPARQAYLRRLVDRDAFSNAVSLNASATNAARIIGPAIAGLLIATVGAWSCFALNAISYLAVIDAVRRRSGTPRAAKNPPPPRRNLLRETLAGVVYIWRVPHLLFLVTALLLVSFIAISFSTILPIYAEASLRGGPGVYGALLSSLGFGAVLGSLFSGSLARRGIPLIFVGAAGIGVGELVLALVASTPVAMAMLAFTGFWMTCFTTSINSVMMLDAPRELHGRVGAVYSYVVTGISPLGSALSGWLAEAGGSELAFGVGGLVAVVVGAAGVANAARITRLRTASQGAE